jgi:hypothetical protein
MDSGWLDAMMGGRNVAEIKLEMLMVVDQLEGPS